jgi:hypothetical protein
MTGGGTRRIVGQRASKVNMSSASDMRRGGVIIAFHSNPTSISYIETKTTGGYFPHHHHHTNTFFCCRCVRVCVGMIQQQVVKYNTVTLSSKHTTQYKSLLTSQILTLEGNFEPDQRNHGFAWRKTAGSI